MGTPRLPPKRITEVSHLMSLITKLSRNNKPTFYAESVLAALAAFDPDQRIEAHQRAAQLKIDENDCHWHPIVYLLLNLIGVHTIGRAGVVGWLDRLSAAFTPERADLFVPQGIDPILARLEERGEPLPTVGVDAIFAMRVVEVATAMQYGASTRLLSYPDRLSGHVDPHRLFEDLREQSSSGTTSWPCDLQQAMLRLPIDEWPYDLVDPLVKLGSPDAVWVANVIAAGPIPPPTVDLVTNEKMSSPTLVTSVRWPQAEAWKWPILQAAYHLPEVGRDLVPDLREEWMPIRFLSLPSQRELVAAHFLRLLVVSNGDVDSVRQLTAAQGPCGPSVLLCLAYGASSRRQPVRNQIAYMLHTLVAQDAINPNDLATTMASVVDNTGLIFLTRWAETLQTAAKLDAATAVFVWKVIAALFAADSELIQRSGLILMLKTATSLAHQVDARGPLPLLDELILTMNSRSKTATLARDLQGFLSSPLSGTSREESVQPTPNEALPAR